MLLSITSLGVETRSLARGVSNMYVVIVTWLHRRSMLCSEQKRLVRVVYYM